MKFQEKDYDWMHITTFAFKNLPNRVVKQFELMFNAIEDYKNDFVDLINKRIEEIEKKDEEIKKIQNRIDELHNTEGKVSKEKEKSDELRSLYKDKGLKLAKYFYEKEGELNRYQLMKDFVKVSSLKYNIYLHDDAKGYARQNVISSLERWMKGEGKSIHKHKHGRTSAIQSKRNINDKGIARSTMIQFIFENDNLYAKMWDLSDEYIEDSLKRLEEGKDIKFHKWIEIKVNINEKDEYQKQIFKAPRYGNAKLFRVWKKNKYFYRLQISLKDCSPVVKRYKNENLKVAIDSGTETVAVVRNDGLMFIEEVSPDTPDFAMEKAIKQQYVDKLTRLSNPERYKENGVPYSRKEAEKLELPKFNFSKNTLRLKREVKTMCAKNARKRKKNNEKTTKRIFELGNEFYIEANNFKAWKMKRKNMNDNAKKIYDNGVRKSDYTKQAQNRATAQIPARLKSLCSQKGFSYNVIEELSLSTYNHFTKKNDIFESLKDRLVTLDEKCIDEENKIVSFKNTFSTIENNGKKYVLQRDLYAASKMLYCYSKNEKVKYTGKDGEEKEKTVVKWYFNQEGYEKFFDEIFYPAQEEYLKKLINEKSLGKKINGTILG